MTQSIAQNLLDPEADFGLEALSLRLEAHASRLDSLLAEWKPLDGFGSLLNRWLPGGSKRFPEQQRRLEAIRSETVEVERLIRRVSQLEDHSRDLPAEQRAIVRTRLREAEKVFFRSKQLLKSTPEDEKRAEMQRSYAEYLDEHIKRNTFMDPRGIMQTERSAALRLDEVYISLTAERKREAPADSLEMFGREAGDFDIASDGTGAGVAEFTRMRWSLPRETRGEKIALAQAVRNNARIVVLGDPGAGKTTLARFLALQFALARKRGDETVRDKEDNEYGAARLPIFFRIAAYAEAFRNDRNLTLRTFLRQAFREVPASREGLDRVFEETLAQGQAFVILDGLDEIIDTSDRVQIARHIEEFAAETHPDNRFLVTSRIAGYEEARLGGAFAAQTFTLCDLEREQIERFLQRWCHAYERFRMPDADADLIERNAQSEINGILAALDENEGVQRLARNPLLLTILALIHRNGARLPSRRIELYTLAVNTLLRDWQLARGTPARDVVEEQEALELLGPLAYWLHENEPTGLIPEHDVKELLGKFLADSRGVTADSPDTKHAVEDFLRRVRQQTGLFVERAPGRYSFMHLTFEEYFAARELVRRHREAAQKIYGHRHKARWEEPILLAIGYESKDHPEDASDLIRTAILAQGEEAQQAGFVPSEYEDILHRDLLFAARCLGDCAGADATLAREIANRLVDLYLDYKGAGRYSGLRERLDSALHALSGSEGGGAAERQLLIALQAEDDFVRANAAFALGSLGQTTPEVISALKAALHADNVSSWISAASALGSLSQATPEVTSALEAALQGEPSLKQISAVSVLSNLGQATSEAISLLIATLQNDADSMRISMVSALGKPSQIPSEFISTQIALLRSEDTLMRMNAATDLGGLGQATPEVLSALEAALQDENPFVYMSAASALGRLGKATLETINVLRVAVHHASSFIYNPAWEALWKLCQT